MKENIEEFYLYVGESTYYCRFIGNKFYRKVTKTKERDMTDNDEFRGKAYTRGQRITKEEYWAGDPKDENPPILSDTRLERALRLMLKAHRGQKDKTGGPEVLHPLRVGLMGENEDEMIVGFLHDSIEDGDVTRDDLEEAWLTGRQIGALHYLTHKSGTYDEYIERLINSKNELAMKVKLNDLKDNIKRGKAAGLSSIVEKHEKALNKLTHID